MRTIRPLRVLGGGLSCMATYSLDRSSFNTEPGLRFTHKKYFRRRSLPIKRDIAKSFDLMILQYLFFIQITDIKSICRNCHLEKSITINIKNKMKTCHLVTCFPSCP